REHEVVVHARHSLELFVTALPDRGAERLQLGQQGAWGRADVVAALRRQITWIYCVTMWLTARRRCAVPSFSSTGPISWPRRPPSRKSALFPSLRRAAQPMTAEKRTLYQAIAARSRRVSMAHLPAGTIPFDGRTNPVRRGIGCLGVTGGSST